MNNTYSISFINILLSAGQAAVLGRLSLSMCLWVHYKTIFSFSVIDGCKENVQELICLGRFLYDFKKSQEASCMHFQCC
jgi:hypothetical protein